MMRKRLAAPSAVGLSIRQAVQDHPGIHFRGLGRAAHVTSAGQLRHHLDRLERQGIIVEVPDGRYKRFFVAGEHDPRMRVEMARFARPVPRLIAKLLLTTPMNRTQLRRSLGCADSTLGYHLARMVALGDLARIRNPTSCLYSLTNGEGVRRILQAAAGPHPLPIPPGGGQDDFPNPLRPRPHPAPDPVPDEGEDEAAPPAQRSPDEAPTADIGADWPILQGLPQGAPPSSTDDSAPAQPA